MVTNNSDNISAAGLVKYDGAGTFAGVTVTQHDLLIGAASNGITSVAPSATSGVPVISQGAAADPTFGTAVVAGGGTGATTLTGVLTGNGTSAFTASAVTQHDVLVGGASNAITSIAPSATSGVPVISQGAAADPAFGTAVVAGGGTGITSATAYAVLTGGTTSTGAFQSIASVGTSGQILTSNGAGALPTFQTSSTAGVWVFLQSQSASNVASINFTSKISATYTTYVVVISKCVPITNAATLNLNVSNDNGSTYIATGYLSGVHQVAYNSSTIGNANSTTTALITGGLDNTAAMGFCGTLWMQNVGNSNNCMINTRGVYINGAASQDLTSLSTVTQTAVNAFQFLMSTGNISTGIFTLYGIKES